MPTKNDAFNAWLSTLDQWDFSTHSSTSIKSTLLNEYQKGIKRDITSILESQEDDATIFANLEAYLKSNWELIQNTCLCYTAIPDAETTHLLCEIAEKVCEYKNTHLTEYEEPMTPIQLLIPRLNVESNIPHYPDFSAVAKIAPFSDENRQELLNINRQLAHSKFPFNQVDEFLSLSDDEKLAENQVEMALHKKTIAEPITANGLVDKLKIERRIAQKLSDIRLFQRKKSLEAQQTSYEQHLKQIESQHLTSFNQRYLVSSKPLADILKTHIMSQDGQAFIPVSVLLGDPTVRPYTYGVHHLEASVTELSVKMGQVITHRDNLSPDAPEKSERSQQIKAQEELNQLKQRIAQIRESEYERLYHHSHTAFAILEAKKRLDILEKKGKSNFFDHLQALLQKLKENDAYSGIGSGDSAGRGAYEPIRIFSDYYETLGYQMIPLVSEDEPLLKDTVYLALRMTGGTLIFTCKLRDQNNEIVSIDLNASEIPGFSQRIKELTERISNAEAKHNRPPRSPTHQETFEEAMDFKDPILALLKTKVTLSAEEKDKIPTPLREAIEKLLTLSKDPSQNINATENLQTCIAGRRAAIETALYADKTMPQLLSGIACSDERSTQQKNAARENLKMAQEALKRFIDFPGVQEGKDKLPLKKQLLEKFNIEVKVTTLDNLKALLELELNDIKTLAFQEGGNQEIVHIFMQEDHGLWSPKIEDLVWFFHEITTSQIQRLLDVTTPLLWNKITNYPALLSSLEGEKRQIVLHSLFKQKQIELLNIFAEDEDSDPEIVALLVDLVPPADRLQMFTTKVNGNTLFHRAVENTNVFKVLWDSLTSSELPEAIKVKGDFGFSLFSEAATHIETLKIVFESFTPAELLNLVEEKNANGRTVLRRAVDCPECLKLLLSVYASNKERLQAVNVEVEFGQTLLHWAAKEPQSLKLLLDLYPSDSERQQALYQKNSSGKSVVDYASDNIDSLAMIFALVPAPERLSRLRAKDNLSGISVFQRALGNPKALAILLAALSESERLTLMEQKHLPRGATLLHGTADNPKVLAVCLNSLNPRHRLKLLMAKHDTLETLIVTAAVNPESLQVIFEPIPQAERFALLDQGHWLVVKHSQSICVLWDLLSPLDAKQMERLILAAILYPDSLSQLLELIPPAMRFEVIKTCIIEAERNPTALKIILESLTEEERFTALATNVPEQDMGTYRRVIKEAQDPEKMANALHALSENQCLSPDSASFVAGSEDAEKMAHLLVEIQKDKINVASNQFKLFKNEPHRDLFVAAIQHIFEKNGGKEVDFKKIDNKNAAVSELQKQLLPHMDSHGELTADKQEIKKGAAYLTLQTIGHLPDSRTVADYARETQPVGNDRLSGN